MSEVREIVKILILIVLWYVVSASNNVIGKSVLMQFPYPMTLTMVQLLSIALYSGPLFRVFGVRSNKQKLSSDEDNQRGYTEEPSWRYWWTYVIPLAFGKFFSSVSGHVSLWKVSVSYAHTVKASMPFFTVLLVRILFGEKQTRPVYISLIPIVCGVMIATATEMSFDMIGLISAVIATIGFSLQNIFSKKVLIDTGMHHLRLLQVLGQIALFMFLPCWLFFDFRSILLTKNEFQTHPVNILLLLFTDGLFSFLQNIFAFSVLSMVTPLTYAVANASKRVAIISVSLLFFRNPVTALNILGMLLAIVGVLGYNKAKYDANQAAKKLSLLPTTKIPVNPLLSNDLAPRATENGHVMSQKSHNPKASSQEIFLYAPTPRPHATRRDFYSNQNPYSALSLNAIWN